MSISDVRDSQRTPASKPRRYELSAARRQAQLSLRLAAEEILGAVAARVGLTGDQLRAGRGCARNSELKFEAAWLMRQRRISWPIIGKTLGYSTHQTAIHAARRWAQMLAETAPAVVDLGSGPAGVMSAYLDQCAAQVAMGSSR